MTLIVIRGKLGYTQKIVVIQKHRIIRKIRIWSLQNNGNESKLQKYEVCSTDS